MLLILKRAGACLAFAIGALVFGANLASADILMCAGNDVNSPGASGNANVIPDDVIKNGASENNLACAVCATAGDGVVTLWGRNSCTVGTIMFAGNTRLIREEHTINTAMLPTGPLWLTVALLGTGVALQWRYFRRKAAL